MSELSIFDQGAFSACPQPFNMAAYVLAQAKKTPEKIALELVSPQGGENWRYADLERAVAGTAQGLHALGLCKGDPVMLRLGNDVNFPIAFLGAIWGGFIPVPTSVQLTPPEFAKLCNQVKPALIIKDENDVCGADSAGKCATLLDLESWRNLLAAKPDLGSADRAAYVIFTSGTSGQPRAVCHAHRAIWARRMMWSNWCGLSSADRVLHAGQFNWTYTLGTGLMDPWAIGATALIPAPNVDRNTLTSLIRECKASIFAAAPGVYRQMLKQATDLDFPDLRHGLSAGEKLPPMLHQNWQQQTGTKIYEALGMSEVSTFVSASPENPAPPGVAGHVQPGRRVAVLGPDDKPVAVDQPGILAVSKRDPGLMLGYGMPGITPPDLPLVKGEWFLTGDTVSMAQDGAIRYLGRGDDMMNAGGFRVSPIEVEAVLNTFDGISECATASVEVKPDTFVIAAFYVSDLDLADDDLQAHCEKQLARYKMPRIFRRMNALPKGANNKIKRAELRKMFGETK